MDDVAAAPYFRAAAFASSRGFFAPRGSDQLLFVDMPKP